MYEYHQTPLIAPCAGGTAADEPRQQGGLRLHVPLDSRSWLKPAYNVLHQQVQAAPQPREPASGEAYGCMLSYA